MARRTELTGRAGRVEVAPNVTLEAPGLLGAVTALEPEAGASRGDAGPKDARFLAAAANVRVRQVQALEMEVGADRLPAPGAGGSRADGLAATTREDEPALVLRLPRGDARLAYAALYSDEAGGCRWLLPEPSRDRPGVAARGDGAELVFHLPRNTPPRAPQPGTTGRGPLTLLGRRLVKVLTWVTDDLVGAGAIEVAAQWEATRVPYNLHWVTPGAFQDTRTFQPADWAKLAAGPALLMLHGTFSNARGTFGDFVTSPQFRRLYEHYGQRVVAFNHPSLHQGPDDNIRTLLGELPPGGAFEVDLLTHSRGGLVGRELVERQAALGGGDRSVRVRRAVYVAAPHHGTVLADGNHWLDFVDRYTNLAMLLPDTPFLLLIEGVLTAVKLLAHGALGGLPGLRCLVPTGDYLTRLNTTGPHSAQYYGMGANFTPEQPGLAARFGWQAANAAVDALFGEANDGVVPALGAFETRPSPPGLPVPPPRRRLFDVTERIHHCGYFEHEPANQQIADWLMAQ